jgi:hypothetical protein
VSLPGWLPPLVRLEDYAGDWERYEAVLYQHFRADFLVSRPEVLAKPVIVRRHPKYKGKEWSFWHLTTFGSVEEERLPDFRRCERIRWPRALIESCDEDRVAAWEKGLRKDRRLLIALPDFSYLVVLAKKKDHLVLITAYCIEQGHERRNLAREWERNRR